MDVDGADTCVQVNDLTYHYTYRREKLPHAALTDVNISIPKGARVLVVGQNGAGKSTLLKLIAGKLMVPKGKVMINGRDAFHDTTMEGCITYLGEWWAANRNFLDITVEKVIGEKVYSERGRQLASILRVDPKWQLGRLSDGQLRRAQILIGMHHRTDLVVLDEITTDVDILVRDALLKFLRKESEEAKVTVLYATHIFDGLEEWDPTHVLRVRKGKAVVQRRDEIGELVGMLNRRDFSPYFRLVRGWLEQEFAEDGVQESPVDKPWQMIADGLRIT